MEYFDDLNPYLVRQDDTTLPATNSDTGNIPEIYLGNILRLNIGKLGTFYFTFSSSNQWRDRTFTGILEDAGMDYFIIKDPESEKRYLLSFIYYVWSEFDEELDHQYNTPQ
ncbi:spore gernimation protein GerQ [Coprobacillus sp. AF33-1AC]|nr:spore gernimation protein GerQ [Coprobacillus sp. AF33-1AC]